MNPENSGQVLERCENFTGEVGAAGLRCKGACGRWRQEEMSHLGLPWPHKHIHSLACQQLMGRGRLEVKRAVSVGGDLLDKMLLKPGLYSVFLLLALLNLVKHLNREE